MSRYSTAEQPDSPQTLIVFHIDFIMSLVIAVKVD